MKNYVIVIAAAILSCTLMSGRINVNLQHNMHLPKELTNKTTVVQHTSWFSGTTTDVYLTDEITSDFVFRDVIQALDTAQVGDTVVLHIAGFGGEVDTAELIINHMKTTKAKVIAIVEAPAYSGHAYIALSADVLLMDPYAYLMMHTSSAFGEDCSKDPKSQELDRAETNQQVCETLLKAHLDNVNRVIMDSKFMTAQQKLDIINGKTVILRLP